MVDEKDFNTCYKELINQAKKLFNCIEAQNKLKERLQRDSYRYIDIYGQLIEYHEAISSAIHSISCNIVKADNVNEAQKISDEDLEKLYSDGISLHSTIKQAMENTQCDEQPESKNTYSFMDYYSYESNTIRNHDIFSLNNSVKELIELEKERFGLESQLYRKIKCQTEMHACNILASIKNIVNR